MSTENEHFLCSKVKRHFDKPLPRAVPNASMVSVASGPPSFLTSPFSRELQGTAHTTAEFRVNLGEGFR